MFHSSPSSIQMKPEDIFNGNYKCNSEISDLFNSLMTADDKTLEFGSSKSQRDSVASQKGYRRSTLPVMGKAALLYKADTPKEEEEAETFRDSKVIHELVLDRFYETLVNQMRKSITRYQQRSTLYSNDGENSEDDEVFYSIENSFVTDFSNVQQLNKDNHRHSQTEKGSVESGIHTYESSENDSKNNSPKTNSKKLMAGSRSEGKVGKEIVLNKVQASSKESQSKCMLNVNDGDVCSRLSSALSQENINVNESQAKKRVTFDKKQELIELKREKLRNELIIQHMILPQINKAVEFCKIKTTNPKGLLEAENLLLLSTLKIENLIAEIQNLREEVDDDLFPRSTGQLSISNLAFLSKQPEVNQKNTSNEFYTCIVSYKGTMFCSEVSEAKSDGIIKFEKSFSFKDLPNNFEINVALYSMKVKVPGRWSFLTKSKRKGAASIRKFLKDFGIYRGKYYFTPRFSSFAPCGTGIIKIGDLKSQKQRLTEVTKPSLNATFFADLEADINVAEEEYTTILNFGRFENGSFIWSKYSCTLEKTFLKLYDSPDNLITSIDLRRVIDGGFGVASRSLCPRPRTLMLNFKEHNNNIQLVMLSTDTVDEMKNWEKRINHILLLLRQWNCTPF